MKMKCLIGFAGLLCIAGQVSGLDLKEARFTQVVNEVKVTRSAELQARQAQVNDLFATPEVLRTGVSSRAELMAADQTITRVGANTVFSFDAAQRTIDLDRGSLLFVSPKGKGGGTIRSRAATAAVLGTTLIVTTTSNGGFKVLLLEGKGEVRLNNGRRQVLTAGQMSFVLPGADRFAPVINIRLDTLVKGSQLVQGFRQPLPSLNLIQRAIKQQSSLIQKGRAIDTGLLVGDARTATGVQIIDANLLQTHIAQTALQLGLSTNVGPSLPFQPPATGTGLESDANINSPQLDSSRFSVFGRLYLARNISVNTPTVDLSPYNSAGQPFEMYAAQSFSFQGDATFQGLTDPGQDLFLWGGQNFTVANNASVTYQGTGNLTVLSPNAMSFNNSSFVDQGKEVNLYSTGADLSLQGGRIQADTTSLIALRDLTVNGVGFAGLSAINMAASTINLSSVDFPANSTVLLSSRLGQLAGQPNTGQASVPGYVNFITGVNYGGQPAQNFINKGITITPNGLGTP